MSRVFRAHPLSYLRHLPHPAGHATPPRCPEHAGRRLAACFRHGPHFYVALVAQF